MNEKKKLILVPSPYLEQFRLVIWAGQSWMRMLPSWILLRSLRLLVLVLSKLERWRRILLLYFMDPSNYSLFSVFLSFCFIFLSLTMCFYHVMQAQQGTLSKHWRVHWCCSRWFESKTCQLNLNVCATNTVKSSLYPGLVFILVVSVDIFTLNINYW